MIIDPRASPDQLQNLTTSRESPLAHADHVWSTSVTTFDSYPAHRQTDRQNDRTNDHITPPVLAE